jgi:hypothetical protein
MVNTPILERSEPTISQVPSGAHSAFKWHCSEQISSLNIVMEKYVHTVTGAIHYHMASTNNENVFLVAFRTLPTDSTGVAHIFVVLILIGDVKLGVAANDEVAISARTGVRINPIVVP